MQDQLAISAIVRCVLKPHHSLLRKEVARAADLTGIVVVEQRPPLCRILLPLYRLFQQFRGDLEEHLEVLETRLFPRLIDLDLALRVGEWAASSADEVSEALRLLRYSQNSITNVVHEMRELTHGFTAPPGACDCYGELLDVLAAIQMEVTAEMRMESSMLFPQAADLLDRARYGGARDRGATGGLRPAHAV